MKSLKKLMGIMMMASVGAMAQVTVEAPVPVNHVFSPAGFDSDDHSEVVITGYLPNLCYKAPMTKVEVHGKKVKLGVNALKVGKIGTYCPEMIVPFMHVVDIGVLDKGKYDVVVNENSEQQKLSKLIVSEAISDATEPEVFANVVNIERVGLGNKIVLKGYNPSDCFELKRVEIKDNGEDTYTILPYMKQVRDFCPKKEIPFEYEVMVPKKLKADRILLHVKIMDGKSVNSLFKNPPLDE